MKNRLRALVLFSAICIAFTRCRQEPETKQAPAGPNPETEHTKAPDATGDSLASFQFSTEMCDHTGFYEKGKYTPAQLANTHDLRYANILAFKTEEIVEKPEELTAEKVAQRLKQLDAEYVSLKAKLQAAETVKTPFWEKIKRLRLLELEEVYAMKKLTLQAHTNPKVLLNSPYAGACPDYVKALASADTAGLFRGRRKLLKDAQKQNGAPENLARRYREEYNSPDRIFWARKELLAYGWWNCANHQREYGEIESQYPLDQEFEKLFVTVRTECEAAD